MPDNDIPNTIVPPRKVLPLPEAIMKLAPGSRWHLVGFDWEGLVWEDDPALKPSREAVEALAEEILAAAPMKELRRQRDNRMKETDWVTMRAMRLGEPIPQEWQDYMNALADLPNTATPFFIEGRILGGVEWPARPDGKPAGPFRGY